MRNVFTLALLCLQPACSAFAGSAAFSVTDAGGKPLANAVVELIPAKAAAPITSRVPAETGIDQSHEMFQPLVNVLRKGGRLVFLNHDTTMHQVYSFSVIKQFQFEIRQGQRSEPVIFDKAGVAAVGCNIHDQMIAYVFVSEAPFAAVTGESGRVRFEDVPTGAYEARIWHPRLRPGDQPVPHRIAVGEGEASDRFALPVQPAVRHAMHMGSY